ncbi:MAG: DNA polymerase [Planctomycetaceae bacterium]
MSVGWLFVDMNAYFASVEQQLRPELRGRPIAVAPVMTDRTCCIAASYEAKRFGIRTGTNVAEARRLCPELEVIEARPETYVRFHHRIVAAVDSVLPVDEVCSIDEMACRLGSGQQSEEQSVRIAREVKHAVREQVGEHVRCSVGLAPNKFLAKIAGDMQKPDGLTRLAPQDIPQKLYSLQLNDLTGIGPRMHQRLQDQGVHTVRQLCALDRRSLRKLWNSVIGEQWWYLLRGYDLPVPRTCRRTLGHSHVLPPAYRTDDGARAVLLRLIHKGAARLRRAGFWATRLTVRLAFVGGQHAWEASVRFRPCQDTTTFVEMFADLWKTRFPGPIPLKAAVTFSQLIPAGSVSRSLLVEDRRRQQVAETMDAVNERFGTDCLYLASLHDGRKTAPARIAFRHIPDVALEGR